MTVRVLVVVALLSGCTTSATAGAARKEPPAPRQALATVTPTSLSPLAAPFALLDLAGTSESCGIADETSRCRFVRAEARWPQYAAIRFVGDPNDYKEVADVIERKKTARDALAREFYEIANVAADEWGVAAMCRSAEVLLDYGNLLVEIEPPPPKSSASPFVDEPWTAVFPVYEQAIWAIERTEALAKEAKVESPYVARCRVHRAALRAWLDNPYSAPRPIRAPTQDRRQ